MNVAFPNHIEDKIFEIKFDSNDNLSKIVSYFPFSESEKQEIQLMLKRKSFDGFSSIFVDNVSDSEWERTKDQIKKKFNDELFDIDKKN